MIQNCDLRDLPDNPGHKQCSMCGAIIATLDANAVRRCDVEAPDPPERDPATLPCRWRGELLRTEKSDVAGGRGVAVSVFACQLGSVSGHPAVCALEPKLQGVTACLRCVHREPPRGMSTAPEPAPIRNAPPGSRAWEGMCPRKPWEYDVTAMIPVLDCVDDLPVILELLRLQTLRPFILLIDTGSTPENAAKLEALRADDVELHLLRLNGFAHSSESVSMAMDTAFALCRTPYLFCTHSDVFLKRRDCLAELFWFTRTHAPVVGYQMTPRSHADWRRMVGHSYMLCDMRVMWYWGITWSMRRGMQRFGLECGFHKENWPDTEVGFNYALWEHCQYAHLIGEEENFRITDDDRMTHCRSLPGSAVYSPSRYAEARAEADAAREAAEARIAEWKANPLPEFRVLPSVTDPAQWKRQETPEFLPYPQWLERGAACPA